MDIVNIESEEEKRLKIEKVLLTIVLLATVGIASGCLQFQTPSEKIYEKLEEVVAIEKDFEEQQDPLVTLEKKEQEYYSNIIELGLDKMDEINKISDKALESIAKRKEHMDIEEASIQESKQAFETIQTHIEDIEETELKEKAQELYDTMMNRYSVHDELYENYSTGLLYDQTLYEMFKKEDLSIDDLEEQIKKINDIYQVVLENNEKFNELTKKYNELKLSFYEESGIEVSVKEEEE